MAILNPYNYQKPAVPVAVRRENVVTEQPTPSKKSQQNIYLEQKVMTAKPEELTLMLYEGLVKFIKLSCLYIDQKNYSKTNENAQRAQAIVDELRATLNMDYEVSEQLDKLYLFILDKLLEGNISKTTQPFREAQEIAEELTSTWKEAIKKI